MTTAPLFYSKDKLSNAICFSFFIPKTWRDMHFKASTVLIS